MTTPRYTLLRQLATEILDLLDEEAAPPTLEASSWKAIRDAGDLEEPPHPAAEPRYAPNGEELAERATIAVPATSWRCPAHNSVKTVPAGVSKKTGKPYSSFIVCGVRGCEQPR